MERELFEKLYTLDHIPALPTVGKSVNSMLAGADIDNPAVLEYISGLICYDPSLTLEILKIANSEVYGFKRKVSSVLDALRVLNNDLIKLIFTQHPVLPQLEMYDERLREELALLVKHSIEVHMGADELMKVIRVEDYEEKIVKDEVLAAATIHDIGIYFLAVYFPREYVPWIEGVRETGLHMRKRKREIYALPDHSLIGSILSDIWNLPLSIVRSIALHHSPWAGYEKWGLETDLIYLADCFSPSYYRLYYGEDVYTVYEHIAMKTKITDTMERLRIAYKDIPGIINRVQERSETVFRELGLIAGAGPAVVKPVT
jgi:HD-like signal output (HDOD) protein